MIKKLFHSQKGFTILESIVAIFILSMSISGVFAAISQSLRQTTIAKDEIRAFYLAQEAVDAVRNRRDINQLTRVKTGTGDWLDGITQGVDSCPFSTAAIKNSCTIDGTNLQIFNCGPSDWDVCPVLNQDPVNFLYGYNSSWVPTGFRREIQFEYINENEIAITVRIAWNAGIISREFEVKTTLFNWL
jgi:prepilin-type N-terminal cleavage/methylation domain-containing protein